MIGVVAIAIVGVLILAAVLDVLLWGALLAVAAAIIMFAATLAGAGGMKLATQLILLLGLVVFCGRHLFRWLKARRLPAPKSSRIPPSNPAARLRWANREGEFSED